MGISQQIDINSIPENVVNLDEFSQEYKTWINGSNLLLKKSGRKYISEGEFDSNLWILLDDVSKQHRPYNFNLFNPLIKKRTMSKDDITVIKCWMVESIRDDFSCKTLGRMFSSVLSIIVASDNFNLEALDDKTGDAVATLLSKEQDTSHMSYYVSEYIYFLERTDLVTDGHLIVLNKLESVKSYIKSNMRILPKGEDIFTFHYYLKKFNAEESNVHLLNFYRPVLLWWKITNVIPMRPSEFSYKLKRECLSTPNGKFFLNVNRVKVTNSNPERKEGRIPLISEFEITKEIYDLIMEYIASTSFDTETKTLISYKASLKFRNDFFNENKLPNDVKLRFASQLKEHNDTFTRRNLEDMINSFYDLIIEGKYKDSSIQQRLLPGDTRHLAFTSLILQGVSPIRVAMLGGHTTLSAQDSYTGHVEYYIDSEILNFLSTENISTNSKILKEIIMNKPYTCPRFTADCSPTEDGIGYCTIDMENGKEICDRVECCIYCTKWWCAPTNENYISAKNHIESYLLGPLKQAVLEEEQFLLKCLSIAKVINIEGLLELDRDSDKAIRQSVLKLKSDADRIIFLKKSILEATKKKPVALE